MKKFVMPTLDVENLDVVDVIAASIDTGCPTFVCDNDGGEW